MNRVTRALSHAVLFAGLALPAVAVAQEEQPTMEAQAMRFERVEGPDQENVPGGTIMVVAYAVIWLLLLGFVVRLGLLHRGTAQDVGRLERSLAAAIARESKAPAARAAAKPAAKKPEPAKKAEAALSPKKESPKTESAKKESAPKEAEAESAPKRDEVKPAETKASETDEDDDSDDDEDGEPESKG